MKVAKTEGTATYRIVYTERESGHINALVNIFKWLLNFLRLDENAPARVQENAKAIKAIDQLGRNRKRQLPRIEPYYIFETYLRIQEWNAIVALSERLIDLGDFLRGFNSEVQQVMS